MSKLADPEINEQAETCCLEDCELNRDRRGYCNKHYKYLMKKGLLARKPPGPLFCTEENCDFKSVSRGLCQTHSARARHNHPPLSDRLKCRIDGCSVRYHARRLCRGHYRRIMRHGDPLLVLRDKNRGCLVSDCSNEHAGKGYCAKHLKRFRLYGDSQKAMRVQGEGATPEERFWSRIDKTGGETACWRWRGAVISESGYGLASYGGKRRHTHRIAWLIKHGELPDATISQICGNRLCCNPAHLKTE